MENMFGDFQRNGTVVNELTQGKDLANELKRKLHHDYHTSREESCNFLLEKILTHYDNALSLLDCMSMLGNENPLQQPLRIDNSNSKTPKSRNDGKDVYKKRKVCAKKNEEVRVCSGNGLEGHLNDGYNWRKYGQKNILGAIHPRAYYRCTHRYTQGCLATKKVQQMDKDPSIFEVIYKGKHSCIEERPKQNKSEETVLPVQSNEQLIALPVVADSRLDTENITLRSFQSAAEHVNTKAMIIQEFTYDLMGTTDSTPFLMSPETSESYFSMSGNHCQMNGNGIGSSFFGGDSEFNEIISDTTSLSDFQLGDLEQMDFGSRFFDAPECFYPSYM